MEGWIVLAVIVALGFWAVSIYNGLVALRNRYKNSYAQIDVQLKRRYDLIPNLVEAAKGYLTHERETLEKVIAARGAAMGAAQKAAAANGTAVLVNLPFARGKLFAAVRGKQLPEWAAEFDAASWGQFFLKFLLANEAVTCVIPGMDKPEYVADNLGAARGRLPDAAQRRKMVEFWESLR